jgi:exosortase
LPLEGLSLIMALASCVVLTGGWAGVRRFWQPLFFLVFMIPLPYEFSRAMGAELQRIATTASMFLLRCAGQPAITEGNRILIENITLNVVEACSGLRMLMTFIASVTSMSDSQGPTRLCCLNTSLGKADALMCSRKKNCEGFP